MHTHHQGNFPPHTRIDDESPMEKTREDLFSGEESSTANAAYGYPFSYQSPYTVQQRQMLEGYQDLYRSGSSIQNLLLTERKGDLFVRDGFDMQQAIIAIDGPIVEIAGPTSRGYATLNGMSLPTKPIISNVNSPTTAPNLSLSRDPINSLDKAVLDVVADARALPFADNTIGMLMVSALTLGDFAKDRQDKRESGPLDTPEKKKAWDDEYIRKHQERVDSVLSKIALNVGADLTAAKMPEAQESARIGFLLEAKRALKPNGLLVAACMRNEDILLASKLGFEIQEHDLLRPTQRDWSVGDNAPREVVFRLPLVDDNRKD